MSCLVEPRSLYLADGVRYWSCHCEDCNGLIEDGDTCLPLRTTGLPTAYVCGDCAVHNGWVDPVAKEEPVDAEVDDAAK